ncbi:MAG: hypothetical protein Q9195_005509 [Heterodermia aff. obscurata]
MVNVVVTGNAPYRENKHNTSRDIRDALPSLIKRPGHNDIVVLKYRRDSLDTYKDVLQMMEEMWKARRSSFLPKADSGHEDEEVDIGFAVHLGMTTAVPEFRAETIAYRDGYERPGEDGVYVDEEYFKDLGLPESLEPVFDIDAAVKKVKDQFPGILFRSSANPNQGFCEYRLFSSLAELELNHKSKRGKAVFLHVPADKSPEAIKKGADVATAYIAALVDGMSTSSEHSLSMSGHSRMGIQ